MFISINFFLISDNRLSDEASALSALDETVRVGGGGNALRNTAVPEVIETYFFIRQRNFGK